MSDRQNTIAPICDYNGLIAVEDAIAALLEGAKQVDEIEQVSLHDANLRVLAEDIYAPLSVPPFNASAMDGYAINSTDVSPNQAVCISQRITAGHEDVQPLAKCTAARIFTGAPMPVGSDSVVLQEHCSVSGDQVTLPNDFTAGQNVRLKGCHIKKDALALKKGTRLNSASIGLAASLGIATLPVFRKLKVTLICTGDELVEPGQALKPGQIYNANQYMLAAAIKQTGCELEIVDAVEDKLDSITHALEQASKQSDLIISSGGVSVGDEDHVKTAVETLGQLSLWRICIKPGKPLAYGHVQHTPFIGLPGNPVSSFVTFYLFAKPFILKSQRMNEVLPKTVRVAAGFDQAKPPKRREYIRVNLSQENGEMVAHPYPSQDSATLLSTTRTDGLLYLPEETTFTKGTLLEFISFNELMG